MTYLDEVPMAVIKAGIMCLICCKGLRRKKIKYNVGYKIPPWIMYPKTFARAYIPIAWNNDPTSLVSTMLPAITLAIPTGAVLYEIKLNSLSKSKVRKESVKSVRSIRPSIQYIRLFNPSVRSIRPFNPFVQSVRSIRPSVQSVRLINPSVQSVRLINPSVQSVRPSVRSIRLFNPSVCSIRPSVKKTTTREPIKYLTTS